MHLRWACRTFFFLTAPSSPAHGGHFVSCHCLGHFTSPSLPWRPCAAPAPTPAQVCVGGVQVGAAPVNRSAPWRGWGLATRHHPPPGICSPLQKGKWPGPAFHSPGPDHSCPGLPRSLPSLPGAAEGQDGLGQTQPTPRPPLASAGPGPPGHLSLLVAFGTGLSAPPDGGHGVLRVGPWEWGGHSRGPADSAPGAGRDGTAEACLTRVGRGRPAGSSSSGRGPEPDSRGSPLLAAAGGVEGSPVGWLQAGGSEGHTWARLPELPFQRQGSEV